MKVMIDWNETKWDSYKDDSVKKFRENGEPVTGRVRKKRLKHVDDVLFLNYERGVEHGPFRIEHGGNVEYKLTIGEFVNGRIEGPIKRYYDDGKTLHSKGEAEIIKFVMSNEVGELEDRIEFNFSGKVEYFNEEGILHLIVTIKEVAGQHTKKLESYYSNGQLESTYKYVNYEIEGEKKVFYKDGTLKQDSNYKNDELHGPYKDYHVNGSLKSEGIYKNGFKDGKWYYYYESGTKKREEMYDITDYYTGKSPTGIGLPMPFKMNCDGRVHGTWRYYDEEGKCVKEENYKNDYQHGITTIHHPNGTTTKKIYDKGRYKGKENAITKILRGFIGG